MTYRHVDATLSKTPKIPVTVSLAYASGTLTYVDVILSMVVEALQPMPSGVKAGQLPGAYVRRTNCRTTCSITDVRLQGQGAVARVNVGFLNAGC
jgi:hypothetical protein